MERILKAIYKYQEALCVKYTDLYGKKKGLEVYGEVRKKTIAGYAAAMILFPIMLIYGASTLFSIAAMTVIAAAFTCLPGLFIKNKGKELRRSYGIDMPDFLERISLLLDAGQNLWDAIEKAAVTACGEYSLYSEIGRTIKEIKDCGGSEQDPCEAFCNMAKRCASSPVSSFVSVIVQNSRKGTSELVEIIRLQATLCRNERRNLAKKIGEEATTLMLVPSTLLFIAILVMLLAPAFMTLNTL